MRKHISRLVWLLGITLVPAIGAAQTCNTTVPESTPTNEFITNGHGKYAAPDNETRHARFPHLNPLDETTSHSTRLQTAAAKSLVIPQAGEEANESLREFHANGDGTVTHKKTGLMWKRCAEGSSGTNCATGTAAAMTWSDALAAVAAANTFSYANHNDWRLPDLKELESIVEERCYEPAINTTAFPGAPLSHFWSSSSHAANPGNAWNVSFDYGYAYSNFKSDTFQVRLVRAGQLLGSFDIVGTTHPKDTTPPSAPTGLEATSECPARPRSECQHNISLSWTASNDNVGVAGYKVYRDGGVSPIVVPGNVTDYSDTGLLPSTTYRYTVSACDATGNCSVQSAAVPVTTLRSFEVQIPAESAE